MLFNYLKLAMQYEIAQLFQYLCPIFKYLQAVTFPSAYIVLLNCAKLHYCLISNLIWD